MHTVVYTGTHTRGVRERHSYAPVRRYVALYIYFLLAPVLTLNGEAMQKKNAAKERRARIHFELGSLSVALGKTRRIVHYVCAWESLYRAAVRVAARSTPQLILVGLSHGAQKFDRYILGKPLSVCQRAGMEHLQYTVQRAKVNE